MSDLQRLIDTIGIDNLKRILHEESHERKRKIEEQRAKRSQQNDNRYGRGQTYGGQTYDGQTGLFRY